MNSPMVVDSLSRLSIDANSTVCQGRNSSHWRRTRAATTFGTSPMWSRA